MSDERAPGWYQDPFGTSSTDRRYWDGQTWLAWEPQSAADPTQPSAATGWQGQQQYGGQQTAGGWQNQQQYGGQQYGTQPRDAASDRETTPDGQPLAGWGHRLGAYLIDTVILMLVGAVVAWALGIWQALGETLETAATASSASDVTELQQAFFIENAGAFVTLSIVGLVISAAYHVGFVTSRGATPGKSLVGLRVRLRDEDRNPPLGSAALRWLVTSGPSVLGNLPVLGYLASAFQLLDGLWPLWDARRQAIHDKVAKTNVVLRSRR